MSKDPIKSLLTAAVENQENLMCWFGERMCDFVHELMEAGVEVEDVPKALTDYAKWMRANLDLFRDQLP